MRRNLSGIYIFDQLNGDDKKKPTCIEDCNVDTRQDWLKSLDKEELIRVVNQLCIVLQEIGGMYGICCD